MANLAMSTAELLAQPAGPIPLTNSNSSTSYTPFLYEYPTDKGFWRPIHENYIEELALKMLRDEARASRLTDDNFSSSGNPAHSLHNI